VLLCLSIFTDHLGRLGASDSKLEIGILLPVSEEQWELCKKAIVDTSGRCDGLRTRVSVQATFETFYRAHQLFPVLKLVWTGLDIGFELSDFGQLLVAGAVTVVGHC
jgi:hypothetical protein